MVPSETIDARVDREVEKARSILARLAVDNLFDSPYLVEAIYYHDGFLSSFPEDRPDADPARRVVAHLERELTPEWKGRYVRLLHELWDRDQKNDAAAVEPSLLPDPGPTKRRRRRRTHEYAVDLFTAEGTQVRTVSSGIAILAERAWSGDDPFSTSSLRGGNTVIVFDAATDRFYRYCHLSQVAVDPGDFVSAGDTIGAVGHSGFNASLPLHGHHLHFEVNQYNGAGVRPYNDRQLMALLRRSPVQPLGARSAAAQPAARVIAAPPPLAPSAVAATAELPALFRAAPVPE